MDKRLKKVLMIVLAAAFGLIEHIIIDALKLPIAGMQISLLGVSYYMGPIYGLIAVCLTGVGDWFFSPHSLAFFFPVLGGVVFCGILGKYKRFLDKITDTITLICLTGLVEGIVLAIAKSFILNGNIVLSYAENIVAMLDHHSYPQLFNYLVAGVFTVYPDVTLCFLIMWICHFVSKSLKNKKDRKKSLKRKITGMVAILLAVMSASFCFPISVNASSNTNYISKRFNASSGLAGGTANYVAQTSDGRMWVATYEGLYAFNGKKFELVTNIPDVRSTMCLYVARDDSLWIGNNGTGLVVVRPDGTYVKLDIYDGMPSDNIRDIKQFDETTFYVATSKGMAIVNYDGESLSVKNVLADNQYINKISIASDGTVAFYSSNKKVYLSKNEDIFQRLLSVSGEITTVQFDDNDILYVGESSNIIYLYSKTNGSFEKTGEFETGEITSVQSLCFADDVTYVAAQNGMGYLDKEGKFTPLYADDFSSNIEYVMEDYQGNVWFASSRHGLLCLEKSVFMDVFSFCDAPEAVVNSEVEWNGLLYVGTDKGLLALDLKNGENVSNELTEQYSTEYRIRCVNVDSNNSLWISAYGYGTIEVTENGEIYTYTDELEGFDIGTRARFTVEKSDGSMILSHNGGVAFIKDHKIVKQLVCGEKMCSAYALTIIEQDDGSLLFGTDGEGIWVYKDGKFTQSISRKEGVSSGVILRLVNDPYTDGVFVISGSGLCYLNGDNTAHEVEKFPYYNNLDMWIADDGTVFVLSSAGVFVGSYEVLMSGEGNITLLDNSYGLNCNLTSNPWNYITEDGILYLAANRGIYSLDVHNYNRSVSEYKPMIESVTIDDQVIKEITRNEITIPEGNHKITLTIDINNFTSVDPYVRYYLDRVDKTKKVCLASQLSEVTYENLSHGEYSFYIEVLDDEKESAIAKTTFTIIKSGEPYETTGFLIAFYVTFIWIIISLIITIVNIAINISAAKHKSRYEKMLTKLEREKAQALELALKHEEHANKSKSDFLASMSHEIRTPINAIIGMDTMILRETNQSSIKNYANNVKSASETLLSLINDILDFSKIESGKMELVLDDYDISSVINDLVNMVKPKANAKGLEFKVSIDPEIPAVLYGDSVRLKQIILNILNNAVKYTENGHIKMEMEAEKAQDNQIALSVKVSDTGIGIKEEDINKLFSPYERIEENRNKNVEGTGLGMSITKTLLGLMDSSLCVESEYGKGSTFSFTILQPVKSEEAIGNYEERLKNTAEGNEDIEAFHAPEAEILIVDDVEMNLIVATSLLKRTLIKITTASSGKEAIAISKDKKFDVILLDAMMPEMSGEEILKIIKSECDINKQTPVIVLTANAIKGAKEEYLKSGFDNYLSKPIDGNKLEAMLESYISEDKIIKDFEKFVPENEISEEQSKMEGTSTNPIIEKLEKIKGIDVLKGIETAGSENVYLVVCKNFYDTASGRIQMLEKHFREMDVQNYTIQVHALKSSAKLIGAFSLSDDALEMEMAGREENIELISEKTDNIISEYRRILFEMDEIFGDSQDDEDKPEMTDKKLKRNLLDMLELVEAFDFSTASELFDSLSEYKLPSEFKESYIGLRGKFAEVDHDGIVEIISNYLEV